MNKLSSPKIELLNFNCADVLKWMQSNSVDSLVTDPPAGISFMGKDWDDDKGGRDQWIAWMTEVMKECHRVLKPGAHGLVWAIPRTSHWTATALENAGFEVRDVVTHIFGSGFPKSQNIGKTSGDSRFEGWGTALKPASEHWILVRKPISEPTIAKNVLKYGCGGINIDASRIPAGGDLKPVFSGAKGKAQAEFGTGTVYGNSEKYESFVSPQGRFPSNLVLSHSDCEDSCTESCAVRALDEQSGFSKDVNRKSKGTAVAGNGHTHGLMAEIEHRRGFGDSGGASRFFYCAKASKSDKGADNSHPTVKSTKLMSYLIKLVTPPNGVVLDPFLGSGSTGVSAIKEGFRFIGIEKDDEYFSIAERRIKSAVKQTNKQQREEK